MADTFEWNSDKQCYQTIADNAEDRVYFTLNGGKIVEVKDNFNENNPYSKTTVIKKKELYGSGDIKADLVMREELERSNTTTDPTP